MSDVRTDIRQIKVGVGDYQVNLVKLVLYFLVMGIITLPLLGYRVPAMAFIPYDFRLFLHELLAFIFFGHTTFSNIWAMRVRRSADVEAGLMARAMLRVMALSITLPTSVLVPFLGLTLVEESWGGLDVATWARDAYILFWVVWALQIAPDSLRYAVDEKRTDPNAGVSNAAIRGIISTILVLLIIYLMVYKISILPF